MAVEQVNLTAYASNWKMQRIRLGLAEAAVESARKWTFHTPSTGDLAEDEFWSHRVPVDFSYRGDKKVDYGGWDAYLPGSRMTAPWLDDREAAGHEPRGGGGLHKSGTEKSRDRVSPAGVGSVRVDESSNKKKRR